jgi:hypothetical protein
VDGPTSLDVADRHRIHYLQWHRAGDGKDPAGWENDAQWSLKRERIAPDYQALKTSEAGSPLSYAEQIDYLGRCYKSRIRFKDGGNWAAVISRRNPSGSWRNNAQKIADQMDGERDPDQGARRDGHPSVADTQAYLRELRGNREG